jgi:5-methylcytosine-specific restriction endonuclease McrA
MSRRQTIMRRDKYRCVYCGYTSHLTIDHVIPLSKGGSKDISNCVTACFYCNTRKGNRTPGEAGLKFKYGRRASNMSYWKHSPRKFSTSWR